MFLVRRARKKFAWRLVNLQVPGKLWTNFSHLDSQLGLVWLNFAVKTTGGRV